MRIIGKVEEIKNEDDFMESKNQYDNEKKNTWLDDSKYGRGELWLGLPAFRSTINIPRIRNI